jgi:hypothetical protein
MKRLAVSMLCVAATAATAQVTRVDRPYQAASAASSVTVALPVKPRVGGALEGRTIKTLPSPATPQSPAAQLPVQPAALAAGHIFLILLCIVYRFMNAGGK